jgi:ABC-type multidrug transport system ATPase subunit
MGIIGPSGAGKSTLLKAIRSIMPIASGDISVLGKNINQAPSLLKEIAFVPQDDVVISELTVEENLRFAASLRLPSDWTDEARAKKVEELLINTGLQGVSNRLCSIISGGQRKRVNLALELILDSTFLLADEACSGLSALDTDNVLHLLREIADTGKGVILTIHSPDIEALDLMDTLLVLDVGGVIAYYGPAKDAVKYFDRNALIHTSPKRIFDVLERKLSLKEVKEFVEEELKKLAEEGKTLSAEEIKKLTEEPKRKTSPEQWVQQYKNSLYHKYLEKNLSDSINSEHK